MIQEVFKVSGVVAPRNTYEVLASLMEEVGELATEVAIEGGYSSKDREEGIMGECVDIVTCALDMIWLHYTRIGLSEEVIEQQIMLILQSKLDKWKRKKVQQ